MKLRQIAEAAVYVSAHSPAFIEQPEPRQERPLTEFWLLSRQHLHEWMSAANDHLLRSVAAPVDAAGIGDDELTGLLREILLTELLARVWSAAVAAADRHRGGSDHDRLVRHVFHGHLHARHRALCLMTGGFQLPAAEIPRLDQLRRRCERWTDVLVGHLVCRYGVNEYAFEPDRAREFGRTQHRHGRVSPHEPVWRLILAGIAVSFPDSLRLPPPAAERGRSLARAALAMCPSRAVQPGRAARA